MVIWFMAKEKACEIIDYKDLYNDMKDKPAKRLEDVEFFEVLARWKENDENKNN